MNGVPNAGDQIAVVFDEAEAKETAESRKRLVKQAVGISFNVASGYNAMVNARASNVEIGYYTVMLFNRK